MYRTEIDVSTGDVRQIALTQAEIDAALNYVELIQEYSCTPWQIRKALNKLGLREAVESAVAASSDITIKDGWEFATEFSSDDPFVIAIGAAVGKTAEETLQVIQYASGL